MTTGSRIEPPPPPPPVSTPSGANVDRQMARGAAWMVLGRLLERGIGLVSIVILARLLVPADFGLIGMASVIIGVIELLGTFGFEVALIQNTNAGRAQYDTAWTLAVLLASGIAVLQLVVAAPASWFYDEPRLQPVIMCLALGTLITGFENIGIVAFRKDLHFRKDFNLSFVKKLAMFAVTIPAALILRSYWALVIGQIVGRLMGTVLTYVVQEYRPRFSLAARRELFHFGKWLIVNNMLNFTSNRCADFLVGKMAGARQLGLFNLSYEIATLPSSDLITPINRAIYPGYAIKASDTDTLRRSYLQIIGLIALVTLPAGLGIAAAANLLVPVVLGPAWIDAAPCVALLAIYGVLLAIKANNHYVYLAMGRPWIATVLGVVQIVLLLPLIGLGGVRAGAFGAALGYVAAQAVFTPISLGILCRALQLRVGQLMGVLYRPALAATAMYLGVRFVERELNVNPADGAALIVPLLFCVAIGAALYVTVLYALWSLASKPDGPERRTLDVLQAKLWPRLAGPTASSPLRRESTVMSEVRPLNLRAGELVEVLSEAEILATLDERGTLDGLPFMPEMLAFCGQRLRVDKRADKACDTINYSGSRRMYRAVLLESARCTGAAHGLCQAACPLFWKEAWLRRVKAGEPIARRRVAPPTDPTPLRPGCDRTGLEAATRQATPADDGQPRYRCQATDLLLATSPMTWWDPRQYVRDVRSGNVGLAEVVRAAVFRTFLFVLHHGRGYRLKLELYRRWQAWRGGTPFPFYRGELEKTPRATLDLQAGELVRVKSQAEILKTVNGRNRNHGLSFDAEMVRYCGQVFRVLARVERVIEERTGKMIPLSKDCIILDGVVCQSEYSDKRLFCPRKLYPFWREIWLERVTAEEVVALPPGATCMVATSGPCGGR